MVYYETKWEKEKKKGNYKTKTLTTYHLKLHQMCDYALTIRYDTSVSWPFGLYGEIVKKTKN